MSAPTWAFVLTLSTLCGSRVASGVLSEPRNVRLTSVNMNLVLRWDPPEGAASGLVYTTEYRPTVLQYRAGCVNTSDHECDFTRLGVGISEYGKFIGRVQAQLGAESSAWVESDDITLDRNTIIGPPNVSLVPFAAAIEVSIEDPVFAISTFRSVYRGATYDIIYWKEGQSEKAKNMSSVPQNRVVLNDLDALTTYCVQVQIKVPNLTPSNVSKAVCQHTGNREEVPWVAAVVTFVVMVVAIVLVAAAVVYRESISHFLCPNDALPQHFKADLLVPSNASLYLAMQNSLPPEEICHQVSIVVDDGSVEEARPLEAAGTSCSRQPDV